MLSEENVKFCFLVTFNVIISLIFPGNFIEIHQVSQIFYFFDFNYFRHFLGFFYLYLLQKKLMMSASIR